MVEIRRVILGAGGWTSAAPDTGSIRQIRHMVTDYLYTLRCVVKASLILKCSDAKCFKLRRLHCLLTLTAALFYSTMRFVMLGLVSNSFAAIEMEL